MRVCGCREDRWQDGGVISIAGNLHWEWRKAQKFAGSRERVSAVCPDPLGKIVGPTCNFSIKPYPGHAAEIMLTWDRRRACDFAYYPEINRTDSGFAIKEFPPSGQGIAYAAQFQRPREVVATAARNDQNRCLQVD